MINFSNLKIDFQKNSSKQSLKKNVVNVLFLKNLKELKFKPIWLNNETEKFLINLQDFAKDIGFSKKSESLFSEYFQRNNLPLSEKLINDLDKSKDLISFVVNKSTPIRHKIKKENLLLFKKECNFSEKQYIRDEKEDNMLFEDYLKHFRGEIE